MFSDGVDDADTIELLRETWYRMEYALEITDAVIWEWDHHTDAVTFHPSSLGTFGRVIDTIDELLETVHSDDSDRMTTVFDSMRAGSGSMPAEFRIDRYGSIHWLEIKGRVEAGVDGVPVRSVGVVQDITERKRQARELQEKTERLEEFASVLSHDLRNPLTIATGYLELARSECESEHFADIAAAHDRIETLIDDLLLMAREGSSSLTVGDVPLAEAAERSWKMVDTADATLRTETDAVVRADRNRLQQLLENLVRNAIEHGGTDVTVRIGNLEEATGFYVEDDGRGIPDDELAHVFDSGYSTSADGTGFGLTIVEGIAESHGWELTIAEGDDGGVRIEVAGVDVRE